MPQDSNNKSFINQMLENIKDELKMDISYDRRKKLEAEQHEIETDIKNLIKKP